MADKIRLLPEIVANQIAAGEVVDRPASVVKEMMENAIDAGAHSVKVNYRDGGRELIQIVDDGCGMSPIDARLAFDRHATSKIRAAEDIYALSTYGFRGEALASIAAVAQVELRTRQAEDEIGTSVEIHGGIFQQQSPVMCPVGSQFFVRNIYFNMPVRRSQLEKSTTSGTQIKSEFQRVALCYPAIEFELYANDALIYQLPATTQAGRIVDLVGRSIKQNLLEVEASTSIASVRGFIGRPSAAKRRNTEQYLFVNGRYFENGYLVSALMRAYEKLIPQNVQPSYFLFLEIDPMRIDVNIHPKKTEVRFADKEAVWQIINAAVRETLAKSGAVPMMDFDHTTDVEIPVMRQGAIYREPRAISREDYNPFSDSYIDPSAPDPNKDFRGFDVPFRDPDSLQLNDLAVSNLPSRSTAAYHPAFEPSEEFDDFGSQANSLNVPSEAFRPVAVHVASAAEADGELGTEEEMEERFVDIASSVGGSTAEQLPLDTLPAFRSPIAVGGAMAVALWGERLVAIDLRRARERICYEQHLRQMRHAQAVSQQLLFPERLLFSREEYELLEAEEVTLAALGFDLRFGEECAIEVHGLPAEVSLDEMELLLAELLQSFAEPIEAEELRRERAALILARNAARTTANRPKSEELVALLEELLATLNYTFSPSGKPIIGEISVEELRAKLG